MATSPLTLEERRRRRDQRAAVEAAQRIVQEAATDRKTVTVEWAVLALMLGAGLACVIAAKYRDLHPVLIGTASWIGVSVGAYASHIILRKQGRLWHALIGLFVILPMWALAIQLGAPERDLWTLYAVTAAGGALVAGGVRWLIDLRKTLGTLGDNARATADSLGRTRAAVGAWMHDAIRKWMASLILIIIGSAMIYVAREQRNLGLLWGGFAVIFLIGAVGIRLPGLNRRTPFAMGIRHCGQLCFWLSLLVVPFIEFSPELGLPYVARPSIRFVAMGLGIVIIGATWFLQKTSIFSHHSVPEDKNSAEKLLALLIVTVGLLVTLAAASAYQRSNFTIDTASITHSPMVGNVMVQPTSRVTALDIVSLADKLPLGAKLPVYIFWLRYNDNSSQLLIPFLYPGNQTTPEEHGLAKAVLSAGGLTSQPAQPNSFVQRFSK